MDKQAATTLIEDTFKNSFSEDRFRYFIKNLLNDVDEQFKPPISGSYMKDSFKDYIRQYKRIGKYTDSDGEQLDILIVNIKKETSLTHARTMQRNFVASYLKTRGEKDAALVAYHTDSLDDWRFSFIKMEYRQEVSGGGRVKVKEELTPARRYSFLVGKNEPNHTAQQQLTPILLDTNYNPTLSDLEDAFNIESVTKEFFEKYKSLFLKVKEELDCLVKVDQKIQEDFDSKNIQTADFAKKLLGQITFLYFLQKKGWLGVEKDEDGTFQKWGEGPQDFLRRLFEKKIVPYDNFFNDLLEPLFYEALALDRGMESYYSSFNCRIPFLNGGLFEPICGYNWQETDILIKNSIISEVFDTFDLYNFTVREDEPLEKEVAVDPEMLGKVFENLLEVTDRKSKGAFYTPREIVHYMCQESLINYLDMALNTHGKSILPKEPVQQKLLGTPDPEQLTISSDSYSPIVPRDDIEYFIQIGEFAIEHDKKVELKGRETPDYKYQIPESIRKNAKLIDGKLADIKVCDPAIGSGAFPVGLLHEIVKAREVLSSYIGESSQKTLYDFKRHAIQESIYGVDIDSSAVDVAKLRLWLSLVVDEDDFESIKPLPNLDYKIVCGNSLLKVERNLLNDHLFQELEALKERFFDETNIREKSKEKRDIESLIKKITDNDDHFDFDIYFSEVFHANGGFDVVIGNPPYIQIQKFSGKQVQKDWEKQKYKTFAKTGDIYCLFYEKGSRILRDNGVLTFITSNKWMRANYGKKLRQYFLNDVTIRQLIDFGDSPIFKEATTYTNILIFSKSRKGISPRVWDLSTSYMASVPLRTILSDNSAGTVVFSEDAFIVVPHDIALIKERVESVGTPLKDWDVSIYRSVLTGFNKAFIIDSSKKNELIAKDPRNEEIIKPILRGRDIKRYHTTFAELWLIDCHNGYQSTKPIDINEYPIIKEHLDKYWGKLTKRQDKGVTPYNLRHCAYHQEFEKEKIVYAEIVYDSAFYYDKDKFYPEATTFTITGECIKYLTALLNSKLLTYSFKTFYAGGDLLGDTFRYKKVFLENLPVPKICEEIRQYFEILVDYIHVTKEKEFKL